MHALPRLSRTIWLTSAVTAALYCTLLSLRPYPGDVVLKTTMCVLLALVAWREQFRLFAVALLFSAAGDALLASDGDRWFVPGLAAFLTTHLLYATIFLRDPRLPRTSLRGGRRFAAVLIPLFAIVYATFLFPRLGALAVPVVGYIAAIVAMAVIALRVAAVSVPVGAVLFMVSDSLLALDKFVWQADWIGPTIWITYAAAQLLIAFGMIGRRSGWRLAVSG
jgi:uncharacterized membrane protein YhhN